MRAEMASRRLTGRMSGSARAHRGEANASRPSLSAGRYVVDFSSPRATHTPAGKSPHHALIRSSTVSRRFHLPRVP